jgi:virginiamycin B lyase
MRSGKHCFRIAAFVLTVVLRLPALSLAQQVAIGAYIVNFGPNGIAVGPDGALWFTDWRNNQIGRMTTAGAFSLYVLPNANSSPFMITAGPDGALWFTEGANRIGRITTAGAIAEYSVPTANSGPQGIAKGPDGALWFAETTAKQVGRITTAGEITEFPLRHASGGPFAITTGSDGALWFTESGANDIGRMNADGAFAEYPVPYEGTSSLEGIAAGPDGALWFTEYWQGTVGRITTGGVVTEYPIPNYAPEPIGIATGPDGALWFTESYANYIGRITTDGAITQYPTPDTLTDSRGATPLWIAAGPDGALWFSDSGAGRIGAAYLTTAGLSVTPPKGSYRQDLTLAGSMFAPNETVRIYASGIGSPLLATATADASGSFTVTARAPQAVCGPRLFLSVGDNSKLLGAASFWVTPRLILTQTSGAAGSSVVAQGFGFGSFSAVGLYWNSASTYLGTAQADINGTFGGGSAFTITVPEDAQPGPNEVGARGLLPKVKTKASFTVD